MRNSRYLVIATTLTVVTFLPLFAAGQALQMDADCGNAKTTAAMRSCENGRYQKADKNLNAIYTELASRLDSTGRQKLVAAQTAWIRFRDANTDFQADIARGGTISPLVKITALADMTETRIAELKQILVPLRGAN